MSEGVYVKNLEARREALNASLALNFERRSQAGIDKTSEAVVEDAELFLTFLMSGDAT